MRTTDREGSGNGYLFLEAEEEAAIFEDGGCVEAEKIYGGVDVADLDQPPDLTDENSRSVGGRGRRRGRRRRRRRRRNFEEIFGFREINDQRIESFPVHGHRIHFYREQERDRDENEERTERGGRGEGFGAVEMGIYRHVRERRWCVRRKVSFVRTIQICRPHDHLFKER